MKFILYILGFVVFVYLQQQFRAESPKKKKKDNSESDNPLLTSEIEKNKDFKAMYPESSKHIERLKKQEKLLKK